MADNGGHPDQLGRARDRYDAARSAGVTVPAAAEALIAYAYVLEFHADRSAAVGRDARDLLGACIGQLDAAVLLAAPPPVMEELVAALDEQTLYIEVALDLPVSRVDLRGAASRRGSRLTARPRRNAGGGMPRAHEKWWPVQRVHSRSAS
ncbi:MAG TPA: hypothetical protein VGL20_14870 [Candidatus Dormibacteraeota bacterium]|jgi:hypothetical protein